MKFIEKYLTNLKWYDISFVKLAVFFFTLFLVTIWWDFQDLVTSIDWYWYLILGIVFTLPALRKMFF